MYKIFTNKFYCIFFIYCLSIFCSPGLKKVIPYLNYLDELMVIITFYLFIQYFNRQDLIKFIKKHDLLLILLFYLIINFFIQGDYNIITLFRLKYFVINIIFLLMFFYLIRNEKNLVITNKIILIFFYILIIFGVLNFIFKNNFLDVFYNNIENLNLAYRGQNSRIVSLNNNPIIFGFICNIFILQFFYKKNFEIKKINYFIAFITLFLLIFTYSRLAYLVLFLSIIIFLYSKNYKKIIISILILAVIYTFLDKQKIFFLIHSNTQSFQYANLLQIFYNIIIRVNDLLEFRYFDKYILQFYKFEYLNDFNYLVILFGNGYDLIGWSPHQYLIENSFLTIFYEVGFAGLFLYLYVIHKLIKNVLFLKRIYYIGLLSVFMSYILLNNALINNPLSFLFFYFYFMSHENK